jgi:outer membrane biosynthesis protein TonB
MSGRYLILIFICALSGCESPKRAQTTPESQQGEQPKIIPRMITAPARTPVIANSASPVFVDYDSAIIKAVQNRWEELLKKSEHRNGEKAGKVIVKFNLRADGSISDLTVANSTLSPDLTKLSEAAIAQSAPFGVWPDEMKAKVDSGFRVLTFTFHYY